MKRKSGQLRDLELDSESVERFRFPWDQGITTLYKYRSFQGESRDWVEQILLESKIYFSHADEFNDPFDVAPTLVHGGDVNDPAYLRLLKREELRSHLGRGMTRREIRDLRRAEGVPPNNYPARPLCICAKAFGTIQEYSAYRLDETTRCSGLTTPMATKAFAFTLDVRPERGLVAHVRFVIRDPEYLYDCPSQSRNGTWWTRWC